MTYFEPKDPETGKAIEHQKAALDAANKKKAAGISNAKVKPAYKKEDKIRYQELEKLHGLEETDAKLIEAEVGAAITEIVERDWGEGNWVKEYAFDNEEEWLVFDDEDSAIEVATIRVEEDVEENPEWFPDWILFKSIDAERAESFFRELYDEWNIGYVNDIEDEDSDEFTNRLAGEMFERNLITHEEATDKDFDLEDKKDEMAEEMTQEAIDEGNYGFEYYKFNFGNEEAGKLLNRSNLIDTMEVAENVVSNDGAANTLSGYDGMQVDLDNGMVMFRTD
ncbi:hypothetical protein KAU33_08785 [Candidatus Dependentiae bacterium]|nr:hypothetical protein [Candidatus Dependentiae bacterium]